MPSYTDLWTFRKQFTSQFAAMTFMMHTLFIGHRTPHRITFSRSTGSVFSSELIPSMMTACAVGEKMDGCGGGGVGWGATVYAETLAHARESGG